MRRAASILLFVLALALAAWTAGCTGASSAGQSPTAIPSAAVAVAPTATGAPASLTPTAGQFVNPVLNRDFPDPDTLKVGDTYYAYATNASGMNIQVARSTDLVDWHLVGDGLPVLPRWASLQGGLTWAPEVWKPSESSPYVMYFTTRDAASDKQCVGVGTSDKPEGPFQPQGDKAFICQVDQGGTIDPSSFVDDDGTRYVLFKNDGNCCGMPTRLYIQRVSADGLTLEGEPKVLIENDQYWEGRVVEAPTLIKHNGKYHLFYSANNYAGADYAVGHAVADSVMGPYRKDPKPFAATTSDGPAVIGPGGQDVVVDKKGRTWLIYHAWDPTVSFRWVNIDPIDWEGDTPVLRGPDRLPEAMP